MYNTKHKTLILETLKNNEGESYSAKELMDILNLPKATVYRNLEYLYENKVINRYFNDNIDSYEYQYIDISTSCMNHLHLKCDNCGKIYHLTNMKENSFPFIINYKNSIIHGTCIHCEGK